MADDNIQEGTPKKKKAAVPAADENRPKKKRPAEDDEEDRPKKKKKRMDEDEQDENTGDLGNSPLSAIIPVGGSIFALLALWVGVFAVVAGIAGFLVFQPKDVLGIILPAFWPLPLLCGVLSFFTHKHKASYGSITGNMRAILGILASLLAMVIHGFLVFRYFM